MADLTTYTHYLTKLTIMQKKAIKIAFFFNHYLYCLLSVMINPNIYNL